jgi:twitching motility protein PilT
VLVAAPRSGGRRALSAALVDLINRTRRDHVITIEPQIDVVHEQHLSLVSQREIGDDEVCDAARAALREDPDVLVLEDMRTPSLVATALEAAESGQLVIGGVSASDAADALSRTIELFPPEDRRRIQLALAQQLRGVVAQVTLRRIGGGRLAARDVLLNTPAVARAIVDGTCDLRAAIEGGRAHGLRSLNDSLAALVQSGAVDPREAYRSSPDGPGLVDLLERKGITMDTF